jgi:Sulfotransferase family
MTDAVLADHPTVEESWEPRDTAWLGRSPSRFAGEPNRPLFIGGCPRSGTTLLRSLLNNHPDLAIPPETNVVIPAWRKRARYGDLQVADNRRKLAEWIYDSRGRGGQRLRREKFFTREQAIERVVASQPTLGSVFASVYEMFAEAKGKPRWGDKRPRYAGMLDMIFALFPNAQFVNLIRDPRAAAASQAPLGWDDEDRALASAACTWEWSVRRVDGFAPRLRSDQLLDLRFEDLVRDPEGTLGQICRFADLRGQPEIVEEMITKPRRGVFNEGWHDRLAEPISTAPIDHWRERIEPREVALVEHVTRHRFERFGYRHEPGLVADPDPAELELVAQEHARRKRKWRRYRMAELKRRHITYRHPVAAVPDPK